jgi:hypothetical protein
MAQSGSLPAKFQRELDLSSGRARRTQFTRRGERGSSAIEHVCTTESYRGHFEVRMVHDIEEFSPKLDVKALRNPLDRLILENGEIQVRRPRSGQDIAARIASKVEALWVRG